jgi:serine/threonine protein kinase
MTPEKVPEHLGKYRVIEEIARGNMGVVYKGHDPFINRIVALKVAHAESLKDEAAKKRYQELFFNEAHTAGRLRHPNILDIFDAGIDGDICYMVMEHVPLGRTLKQFCDTEHLLPIPKAVEVAYKCAMALEYAHRQGVIHRDIKPSNVLVGEGDDVKIADFSIAQITDPDLSRTMPLGFMGSPRYMSPEQVQEDVITPRTDLFSLGVVFYELLTGRHPFEAAKFSRLIYKLVHQDPPPMRQYREEIPEELERIVVRAMQKDPTKRFRDGGEMAEALGSIFSQIRHRGNEPPLEDRYNKVRGIEFFRGFPDTEIWEVIRTGVWRRYVNGEVVCSEEERGESFFVIIAGEVAVIKNDCEVAIVGAGECFGEMGYGAATTNRSARVEARGPADILEIEFTILDQLEKETQIRFLRNFIRTLAQRLGRTTQLATTGM